jgi:hypothetical protein
MGQKFRNLSPDLGAGERNRNNKTDWNVQSEIALEEISGMLSAEV